VRRVRWLVSALVLLAPWSTGLAAESGSEDVLTRLRAAVSAAVEASPERRVEDALVDLEQAEARTGVAVLSPYVEWQREGIGSGWSREPNAQDAVRLGSSVRLWSFGSARRASEAADGLQLVGREAVRREVAAAVAGVWIEAAEIASRRRLVEDRLERLDRALNLLEARYQLGEVAGIEVRQLDLEHVRATSAAERLAAEEEAALARLRKWAGAATPVPRAGDLEALVERTATPPAGAGMPDTATLRRLAMHRRDLVAESADVDSGRAWGDPIAEVEWERIPDLDGLPGFDAWGFRVGLPLPVGGVGRDRKAEASARHSLAESTLAAEEARLEVRRATAAAHAEAAERRLSALRPAIEGMPETERSLTEQFRLGAVSYLVLVDGLDRLDEVRLEATTARADLLAARLELALLLDRDDAFPVLPDGVVEETP
jgi:outer membrane protein TolC